MGSRIFWVLLAGAALVTGMVVQDGPGILSWGHDSDHQSRTIEAKVDRAIDRSFDHMDVVSADGREIDVTPEQKRALAAAVSRFVKAETDLVMVKVRGSDQEVEAATTERDKARTAMEQLKAQITAQKDADRSTRDRTRDQMREDIREEIREAVRG